MRRLDPSTELVFLRRANSIMVDIEERLLSLLLFSLWPLLLSWMSNSSILIAKATRKQKTIINHNMFMQKNDTKCDNINKFGIVFDFVNFQILFWIQCY